MRVYRILPVVKSAATLVAMLAILQPLTAEAAPKRTYICGDGSGRVTVTVISQKKVRIAVDMPGSMEPKFNMEMDRQGKRFDFANGEYEIKVTKDQNSLVYNAPDFGTANCNWQGG